MQAELAASLTHIAEACAGSAPAIAEALTRPLALLGDGHALPPVAFGLYFDLGAALLGDDLGRALDAAAALSRISPRAPGPVMDHVGGGAAELEAVLRLRMDEGADRFAPITPETHRDFAALVGEGLALLDEGLPALAGEIRAIVHQMLFAQAPAGAQTEFDGASHYQFWGLLLLNPKHHRTPLAVAEVLAHEAGHALLFGLTVAEPLVHNPDDELYPSPLRRDPRPMDGIYHATFVSARMALAMEGLADSGLLSAAERAAARDAAAKDRANFARGAAVVAEHGRLSATGQAIMDNARAWIALGPRAQGGALPGRGPGL
jgi:HEXXH motif-containing protein